MIKTPTIEEVMNNNNLILTNLFDLCFKEIFGNEDYPEITAYLMSTLLRLPYEEVEGKITFISNRKKNSRIKEKNGNKGVTFILELDTKYIVTFEQI